MIPCMQPQKTTRSDGEDELIENSLREEPPLSKLGLMAIGGGGLAVTSVIIASLAGQDPWGEPPLSSLVARCRTAFARG